MTPAASPTASPLRPSEFLALVTKALPPATAAWVKAQGRALLPVVAELLVNEVPRYLERSFEAWAREVVANMREGHDFKRIRGYAAQPARLVRLFGPDWHSEAAGWKPADFETRLLPVAERVMGGELARTPEGTVFWTDAPPSDDHDVDTAWRTGERMEAEVYGKWRKLEKVVLPPDDAGRQSYTWQRYQYVVLTPEKLAEEHAHQRKRADYARHAEAARKLHDKLVEAGKLVGLTPRVDYGGMKKWDRGPIPRDADLGRAMGLAADVRRALEAPGVRDAEPYWPVQEWSRYFDTALRGATPEVKAIQASAGALEAVKARFAPILGTIWWKPSVYLPPVGRYSSGVNTKTVPPVRVEGVGAEWSPPYAPHIEVLASVTGKRKTLPLDEWPEPYGGPERETAYTPIRFTRYAGPVPFEVFTALTAAKTYEPALPDKIFSVVHPKLGRLFSTTKDPAGSRSSFAGGGNVVTATGVAVNRLRGWFSTAGAEKVPLEGAFPEPATGEAAPPEPSGKLPPYHYEPAPGARYYIAAADWTKANAAIAALAPKYDVDARTVDWSGWDKHHHDLPARPHGSTSADYPVKFKSLREFAQAGMIWRDAYESEEEPGRAHVLDGYHLYRWLHWREAADLAWQAALGDIWRTGKTMLDKAKGRKWHPVDLVLRADAPLAFTLKGEFPGYPIGGSAELFLEEHSERQLHRSEPRVTYRLWVLPAGLAADFGAVGKNAAHAATEKWIRNQQRLQREAKGA